MPTHGDEPSPEVLTEVFGARAELARRFTQHLATTGVARGLIGPREVVRLWSRHVLNCAVVHPSIPRGSVVADVGSGAGLPGLVLAIARPDLRVWLIEPLERRTRWLSDVIADLDVDVEVRQSKAEAMWGELTVDVATSRAVASLAELGRLSLPLVRVGGRMVALKGERAPEEIESDTPILDRLGAGEPRVERYGQSVLDVPTSVVVMTVERPAPHWLAPVGDGPARTAALKKQRRKQRSASRRHEQGR